MFAFSLTLALAICASAAPTPGQGLNPRNSHIGRHEGFRGRHYFGGLRGFDRWLGGPFTFTFGFPTPTDVASPTEAAPPAETPDPAPVESPVESSPVEETPIETPVEQPVETTSSASSETAAAPAETTAVPATSTSTTSSPAATVNAISAAAAEYLNAHNTVRANHGAVPLTWSDHLASKAQKWADRCVFEHSGGQLGKFGENLAAGTGNLGPAAAVKMWTDEVSQYDPTNPIPSHFTQVVWKGTTEVGCAVATCSGIFDPKFGPAQFHVCEYNPPGNIIGRFAENVQV